MTIGVYRIYASAGLSAGDLARLGNVLDQLPAMLYRFDRVADRDLVEALGDTEALDRSIRIAMTQSHIAIVRTAPGAAPSMVELAERRTAREGFRRKIPVIAIVENGSPVDVDLAQHEIDRAVPLDVDALTIAIQELTEEASADRRRANEAILQQQPLEAPAIAVDGPQGLPYDQIIEAFESLKSSRGHQSGERH